MAILFRVGAMRKCIALLILAAVILAVAGCQSHSGSREYLPGIGWVPND